MATSNPDTQLPPHMRDEPIDDREEIQPRPGDVSVPGVDVDASKIDYYSYKARGKGLASAARLTEDGNIVFDLDLKEQLGELPTQYARPVREYAVDLHHFSTAPPMKIVIMIVGSRGDVQPYIALSKELRKHGHRVRLATHETFRKMINDAGVEFYAIGGDPAELMSYMVRNPGLLPGFESLVNGDIPKKRKMLAEILEGCWKATYIPDPVHGAFSPDAIISNPPAFAHIHIAEALGIPLHMSFTMPWSATTSFAHPLVVVNASNAAPGLTNYLSYAMADLLQWQGLGDLINKFRVRTLGLQLLAIRSGPSAVDRLRVPWTYCFSPTLIPKPEDWSNHIDVVGFYFLEGARGYTPDQALQAFLDAGEPPVYIGFGSVVVEDAKAMTEMIFNAVKAAGIRAIVSAGWGGLGGAEVPPNIFILPGHPGVPHDWLFTKVSAVCHHGGAGTTAIGLLLGKPTIIVPFFGDQPFWGNMVYKAGAGPEPIPQKKLNVERLANAIDFCKTPAAKAAAERMGAQIMAENGAQSGVDSFHAHLPLLNMRCDLDDSRVAVWWHPKQSLRLSAFAAQVLADANLLKIDELEPHRSKEYDLRLKVMDPVTGGLTGLFWTIAYHAKGVNKIFHDPIGGTVNIMTAMPRGLSVMIDSVQEGFQNFPKLYGGDVRESGPVNNIESGFKEAGKGLFYGLYDGITGLVTEPIKGARQDGPLGILKGSAKGIGGIATKPAAGALGLVTRPVHGMLKQLWTRKQFAHLRDSRRQDGLAAVSQPLLPYQPEKEELIIRYQTAKKTKDQRVETMRQEGIQWLQAGGGLHLEDAPPSYAASVASQPGSSRPSVSTGQPEGSRRRLFGRR